MSRQARVTVAYATVKLLDPATGKWTVHGFYQGAVFPPNADPDSVATLVRREYAEWVDPDPAPVEAPPPEEPAKAEESVKVEPKAAARARTD